MLMFILKKLIHQSQVIIIALSLIGLVAFKMASYDTKKSTAEVEQYQGLYIFVDGKPVTEYEYMGSVKTTFSLGDSQYSGIRDKLIKRTKDKYPNADGIIITFSSSSSDVADAIKFKE